MTQTSDALGALGETGASTLAQRVVDGATGWLQRRTTRRGFLVRAGLLGTALATDPVGFVLKPGTAYASICGPGASCGAGWTVFCATINGGVNSCPPGSIAAGWWKADGAALCGGGARYYVDCNATCARCSTPGRAGLCSSDCWSCRCTCGPTSSCDQRRTCCNAFRYGQCHQEVPQVGGVQCRVVSCTPPWRWANCSSAPAVDNNTRDHSSPQLPTAWTAITARYTALGEHGSALGATVLAEVAVPGGRAQRYQRGRMSASPATGVHYTLGAVAQRYVALHAEGGPLGFPVGPPVPAADHRGSASRFQRGRISWHPSVGAFETRGPIAVRYAKDRAENGPLGYPTNGEQSAGPGRWNSFQQGRISWSPATGAGLLRADIIVRYAALQAEIGLLGFPRGDQQDVGDGEGVYAVFQGGRISHHPTTGTHETIGAIAESYLQGGAERSALGYPTSDEYTPAAGQRRNDFEHGTITFDQASGLATVELVEPLPSSSPSPGP